MYRARSIRILFLSLSLVSRCFYSRMEMYSNDSRGDAALRDSSARLEASARLFLSASKLTRISIDAFLWTLGVVVSASDVPSSGRILSARGIEQEERFRVKTGARVPNLLKTDTLILELSDSTRARSQEASASA